MVPKIFVSEGDHCAWWQLFGQLCGSWRLLWKLPGGQLGQRSIGENPQTMGERPRNLANDHWKVGKVKFFLKTMGLLPSVLLFWKCWKDQWKEGGWPSKLVVKINQKCEVDHPKCTWNQKKCRLSSFWVLTIKHDQFTIKMWVVLSKNWEGMGVKSNDFPQVWTSIRTMWILPGYRRGLIHGFVLYHWIHWIHWIWRWCSYWKDNIRLTMVITTYWASLQIHKSPCSTSKLLFRGIPHFQTPKDCCKTICQISIEPMTVKESTSISADRFPNFSGYASLETH